MSFVTEHTMIKFLYYWFQVEDLYIKGLKNSSDSKLLQLVKSFENNNPSIENYSLYQWLASFHLLFGEDIKYYEIARKTLMMLEEVEDLKENIKKELHYLEYRYREMERENHYLRKELEERNEEVKSYKMMAAVRGHAMINFLYWITLTHPEVQRLKDLPESALLKLFDEFHQISDESLLELDTELKKVIDTFHRRAG